MSKALLEVTEFPLKSVNILEHTDKLIIKVVNYDITYDANNNSNTVVHNSTI